MPTTSRRTTRLGILLVVVVAALTLGLSNAAWAQALSLPDVSDNAFAASDIDIPIANGNNICGNSVDLIGVDVTGMVGRGGDETVCVIWDQIDD